MYCFGAGVRVDVVRSFLGFQAQDQHSSKEGASRRVASYSAVGKGLRSEPSGTEVRDTASASMLPSLGR